MAWCPNCKFEYVDGIKICPDCKTELVDSLDNNDHVVEAAIEELANIKSDPSIPTPEQIEMYERMMKIKETPTYKSKADQLNEHKSGASVLLICGILGVCVLLLNALKIIHLPLYGFTLVLVNIVMGFLFCVFVVSGFISLRKTKQLKPLVKDEEELIEKVVEFINSSKANGKYSLDKSSPDYELDFINLSESVVNDVNKEFPDLEPGFAFYVVDRFAGDILDED